jgi:hypothetical protein
MDLRRTCLQLIENTYAWLYLTQKGAGRPANWSAVKGTLSLLHNELKVLENPQDTNRFPETLQRTRAMLRKTLHEIAAGRLNE